MKYLRFTKGVKVAYLQGTITENHKYKWVNCIALLGVDGGWLYSEHWRTNHKNKACKEIMSLGWVLDESFKGGE